MTWNTVEFKLSARVMLYVVEFCPKYSCSDAQEIRLLMRISFDRNIVQFYGACLETKPPMLVMEYMGVRTSFTAIFALNIHPKHSCSANVCTLHRK